MEGCDVPEGTAGRCGRETLLGWRPLTERLGRKVCEYHFNRHKDPDDDFNLWDAFGFRRPAGVNRPAPKKDAPRLAPEPAPRPVACIEPTVKPEPPQEKPELHPIPATEKPPGCKACGAEREAGHTYCESCGRERKKLADRQRQKRRYEKRKNSHAFAPN